ncbi:MAG: ABC transporter permease [Lachnospiraceae bacterium]|nr:ABC transporter permease [Lachnospiraceae bacterium]
MKSLNKRITRELKSHFGRYLALLFMIVLGMYLVVSVAGMAETTIAGTDKYNEECRLQDGQFTVFVPLTEEQLKKLSEEHGEIEKIFSVDVSVKAGDTGSEDKTLRVFKLRNSIDLLNLDEGVLPEKDDEIVIMNLFAERNKLNAGDRIELSGREYRVSGTGCIPDYNLTVKNFSDMTADPDSFGVAFVTDSAYEEIKRDDAAGVEEYTYAYRLKDAETLSEKEKEKRARELKEDIKDIDFDYKASGNEYLIEYVDRMYQDKTDFEEGLDELVDETNELYDGITEVNDGAQELSDGTTEVYGAVKENNKNFDVLKMSPYSPLTQITDGYLEGAEKLKTGAEELYDGTGELLDGAAEFRDGVVEFDEEVREFLDDNYEVNIPNLESFYENKDNPRIASDAASDVILKRLVSLVAGAILVMLFAYVISVFIIHQINEESSVIGTLYAMGVKKSSLIAHYVFLPTAVTFIAGLIGMAMGFSKFGVDFQMLDSYLYYSIPKMEKIYPLYIILYCLVMPPVISVIVNILVINKKLSKTALSLIKNEQESLVKGNAVSVSAGKSRRKEGNFLRQFTSRQISRERRSVLTVIMGMVVALLIFMIGLNCYVLCNNVKKENIEDINYEYMYVLKYPMEEAPKDAEVCYMKNLSMKYLDYSLDVNTIGIDNDNKYFNFETSGNKKELVIASSTAQKYDLKVGDSFILDDTSEDRSYAFTVSDIVDYSIGLTAYMDIDEMRELFGEEDDYFNMLVSDKDLKVDGGRIYSVTKRADIENAAGIFVDQMMSLIVILIVVSILIFIAVMYLMLNVMIDRAAFGISLVKIFGYRMREIRKVYLDGNFYAVIAGACIGIPIVKKAADSIYPYFIANTAMGMNLRFECFMYAGILGGVVLVYLVISSILTGKIKRIVPAEVLKNRE